jgi:hypothetical protein
MKNMDLDAKFIPTETCISGILIRIKNTELESFTGSICVNLHQPKTLKFIFSIILASGGVDCLTAKESITRLMVKVDLFRRFVFWKIKKWS